MKSLIVLASAASAASLLAFAAPASAQIALAEPEHTGAYGELGYTGANLHGADQSVITGRLGWRFNRFLGAEGELGVGVSGGDRTFGQGTPAERNVQEKLKTNEAAYAVGYLPLTPRADLFARVGYGAEQYKISPNGLSDYNAHSNGFRYGLGGQYFFDGQNGLRADWTRYEMNLSDNGGFFGGEKSANKWTVSYTHRF